MKTLRFRHLLSALAIAALVLPGAGPADAQSKGTIKIATQSPLSGGQSALGEGIKLGAQLGMEKFKGNLEKKGYKVELVPFDDQAKPDVGVANAKNIISDKDIMVVIGHLNSGVAIPSSEVYKEVGLAMISPANTNEKVTDRGYPNVNRVCGRDDVQGPVGGEFAATVMKAKSVYIVHDKTTYGQGVAEAFNADLEPGGQAVRGRVQEEVRQEPRALRGRVLRRDGHRHQGARVRGRRGQGPDPRSGGERHSQGQVRGHDRHHRVRRQG